MRTSCSSAIHVTRRFTSRRLAAIGPSEWGTIIAHLQLKLLMDLSGFGSELMRHMTGFLARSAPCWATGGQLAPGRAPQRLPRPPACPGVREKEIKGSGVFVARSREGEAREAKERLHRLPRRATLMAMRWQDRITVSPDVQSGKPCIKGTRITVYDVLEYLAGGITEAQILADFPDLTAEDIRARLALAA